MIKVVVFNLSMRGFSLKEIEKTIGLPVEQLKELLSEVKSNYKGGMQIFQIMDNTTDIEKTLMEAGNRLFKDLYQKEFKKCVSKGYPDELALIFTDGYMHGVIHTLAKGYYERLRIRDIFNSHWVLGYAQGYTLALFEVKENLCEINQKDINVPEILGVSDQQYEKIKDMTLDDLRIKYRISK